MTASGRKEGRFIELGLTWIGLCKTDLSTEGWSGKYKKVFQVEETGVEERVGAKVLRNDAFRSHKWTQRGWAKVEKCIDQRCNSTRATPLPTPTHSSGRNFHKALFEKRRHRSRIWSSTTQAEKFYCMIMLTKLTHNQFLKTYNQFLKRT